MTGFKSILSATLAILVFSSSFATNAEESNQKHVGAKNTKMTVKCYVEYRGGGEDIRFVIGDFKTPNQAKGILHGRKVIKSNGTIKKIIMKVKECIKSTEKFSTSRAKQLDKSVAR
ncbi:TapY2 family type IVa secretion system protein [Colwellia sp. TT2012]|uniref:TapY2 family type IVa secretion system protein n=1 Tax=Colwellia sp. TT2012 TaxID=1720342 RepID=UPI0007096B3D|nr:TapY2 family type IVa secretion system protein [Colwellia sp. TT2012]